MMVLNPIQIQIPKQLKQKGINFVLLERGTKKPFQKDWQNKSLEFDSPEFLEHLSNGGNYGVRGGGEKNLVIVDFDNLKTQEECLKQLPETFTVKTGSGMLHLYYFSDGKESFKIFTENMDTLADIQGEGKQVVGAGSLHPNGSVYTLIKDIPIAFINYSELKAIMISKDKKPKKEEPLKEYPKDKHIEDNFLDDLKRKVKVQDVLNWIGIDTSHNPTQCPFHDSKGGKCLGYKDEVAHCFHCDGSWNIFSLVIDYKKCDFKEALEILAKIGSMESELEESRKRFIEKQKAKNFDELCQLKLKFLEIICSKDNGRWGMASELLVDFILNKMWIYTTKDDIKSEIWVYKNGIYVPQGRSEIKELLRTILGDYYSTFIFNMVIAKIEPDTYIDSQTFFNENSVYELPVKNGILNVLTKELKEFTPDKIFFNKLPVEYNPEAKCPAIEIFLGGVLADREDVKLFYEMGGTTLVKEYLWEKAFMLVGEGRNGKDKSLELIKRTIGIENCCSIPLASIVPDSFIISEFFGKMANIAGEISPGDLKDTITFKGLTGRSLQTAPRKFLRPITFVNHAKFIFACNQLPMVYDTSRGFWDRWILFEYPYTFVSQEEINNNPDNKNLKLKDENIIEKITTPDELSGLLNKFLGGLNRLMKNKNFSTTKGSKEIKELWIRKSNSVIAFCMDCLESDYNDYITKKELRKKYNEYCKKYGIKMNSDYVIKRSLEETFGCSEGNRETLNIWERTWEGIKWK